MRTNDIKRCKGALKTKQLSIKKEELQCLLIILYLEKNDVMNLLTKLENKKKTFWVLVYFYKK